MPIQPPAEAQPTNGLANSVGYSNLRPEPTVAASATPALGELELINIRLQAIMADMWALQQQLKQHGALDESWQPPSFEVQLTAQETAPLAGGEISAEPVLPEAPIEDPAVLAARKRLEELTPMRVAHHAPPVIEANPADGAISAAVATEADTGQPKQARPRRAPNSPPLIDPLTAGAKSAQTPRRTHSRSKCEPREIPEAGAPAAKTRSAARRPLSAERSDETEPVTTEKAS